MITSDRHFDSPHSDHSLQLKHLEEATARGAAVLDIGDAMDLMGGKFDPRSQKGSIRPEHNVPHYFDEVVGDLAKFLKPYAQNIAVLGTGNHESSMLRRHEFCPTQRLTGLLNSMTGSTIYNGRYSGWLIFALVWPVSKGKNRTNTITCNYHHGISSGSASSNVAAMEKYAGTVPDADVVVTGHAHNSLTHTVARMRLGPHGEVYQDSQLLLINPSYKDGVGDYGDGWEVERAFRPKPLGAHWLRFFWDSRVERFKVEAITAR